VSTRIEGPRSVHFRFSTGRAATLRAVPNFRAMRRDGLADDHDLADLQAVLAGELPASRLDPLFEDALIRHLFIDPAMPNGGVGVLDELEVKEAIAYAVGAYIRQSAQANSGIEDDDVVEDELEDPDEPGEPEAELSDEEMLELAGDMLPPPASLPESPRPSVEDE
jgi:hypothetical protein